MILLLLIFLKMLVPHPDINSLIIHNYLTANSLINVCFTSKHNLYKFWINKYGVMHLNNLNYLRMYLHHTAIKTVLTLGYHYIKLLFML